MLKYRVNLLNMQMVDGRYVIQLLNVIKYFAIVEYKIYNPQSH